MNAEIRRIDNLVEIIGDPNGIQARNRALAEALYEKFGKALRTKSTAKSKMKDGVCALNTGPYAASLFLPYTFPTFAAYACLFSKGKRRLCRS